MKNIILFAVLAGLNVLSFGQTTAVDFTANDCSGNSHNLFTDLNAGKVVVLIWVMPCAACINGALTAQTEVQNARAQNPGKVVFYLCDDNGGTSCTTLSSWAATNGVTDAIVISSANVSMAAYGDPGMPKVIVLGGSQHTVFYNQDDVGISASGIRAGIASALAAPLGLIESQKCGISLSTYPNPSKEISHIALDLTFQADLSIAVYDQLGRLTKTIFKGALSAGRTNFDINVAEMPNGIYFVKYSNGTFTKSERLLVSH